MIISSKFTHADLLAAPEDNKRREIIDGELFVTPSPYFDHQRILRNLYDALRRYLEKHPIGELLFAPLDVILSEYDVLEPDLLFVLNEHRHILKDWVRGAPDLAVEILSSTTASRDRGLKMRTYARYGVREYCLVDPNQRAIEVYRLVAGGYELARTFQSTDTLTSELFPGLGLPVTPIFEP